ncbi:hypothetical protein [Ideonella paludis]|uniref:Uncharacterized protein n=1 Tax=Ideonella paludis TaxID=1233411 RepID=A0ABS5DXP7_9BURK|nr:hypothetical protein [Ideonella paludis]MBQ0935920.1 hypothetical protein [Ideonella paludis]
MKIYKGEAGDCPKQLDVLFTRCTTQVPEVSIPEMLTSEAQANLYGVIIAECIGAQYQGGDALKAFLAFQVRFNESVAGKSGG